MADTKSEVVAANFRTEGNRLFQNKRYKDALDKYTQVMYR